MPPRELFFPIITGLEWPWRGHSALSRLFRELDSWHFTFSFPTILPNTFLLAACAGCGFAVGSSFQHQAYVLLAVIIHVTFIPLSAETHKLLVPIRGEFIHPVLTQWDPWGRRCEQAWCTLIFPGAPSACVRICCLWLSALPSFYLVEIGPHSCLLISISSVVSGVFLSPNGGPSWVTYLETLSTCSVPSVPGKHPFPKAPPTLCFSFTRKDALASVFFPIHCHVNS